MEAGLHHEQEQWALGKRLIAGVDEVGRGCLLGDVVAAAVILPQGMILEGVNDSKKLSERKRESLYELIQQEAVAIGIGVIDVATIERVNIKQAARLAMKAAVEQLQPVPDMLLVDAEKVDVPYEQLAIIHGDAVSQSIAAASIIAKVTRDRMCRQWDSEYPEYGIAIHKGYATKAHRERIMEFGPCPLHRRTFLRNIEAQQQVLF
ncbi:ribonuclease HII [Paenibacillus sp. YYML68]|uniref:ribonuclease HII n=1 Tax=Paenibacillus sp. YYML68 TaxID=2909250 RepID=UPI00248FAE49|nr:ribonuclease HII [Paenibacillus sp. YYML68]